MSKVDKKDKFKSFSKTWSNLFYSNHKMTEYHFNKKIRKELDSLLLSYFFFFKYLKTPSIFQSFRPFLCWNPVLSFSVCFSFFFDLILTIFFLYIYFTFFLNSKFLSLSLSHSLPATLMYFSHVSLAVKSMP